MQNPPHQFSHTNRAHAESTRRGSNWEGLLGVSECLLSYPRESLYYHHGTPQIYACCLTSLDPSQVTTAGRQTGLGYRCTRIPPVSLQNNLIRHPILTLPALFCSYRFCTYGCRSCSRPPALSPGEAAHPK